MKDMANNGNGDRGWGWEYEEESQNSKEYYNIKILRNSTLKCIPIL